ncbi:FABP family protein [Georgenia yuyongxinii]|uniref:Ferric nitrobindin-like protein n=1 Tax=Georgenia yuyongxinii TaxID=2589797 RepID=A0A552WMI8_9MICO|nr:FABP family protein [Georgenia yuyongxinii]TRW43998.1 FABP family protein [Georgenia yuyongxinii]
MAFTIPDDLAPECYPLAWLLGRWRGFGMLGYPGVDEQAFVQEILFDHDGGPYLRAVTTIWLADTTRSGEITQEMTGTQGAAALTPGQLWSTETSYWRPVVQPTSPAVGNGAGASGASPGQEGAGEAAGRVTTAPEPTGAGAPAPDATELEVLVADPSGHLSVYVGAVRGPRVDLSTDAVVRTVTAAEMSGATRMYGLVQHDLLWAMDLAAFGRELQSYASGRLSRQE